MMDMGAGAVNDGQGCRSTGCAQVYLLFQEGQQAAQSHCIPEMGLTHPLNLHLQATATAQHCGLSLDFMNERMKP